MATDFNDSQSLCPALERIISLAAVITFVAHLVCKRYPSCDKHRTTTSFIFIGSIDIVRIIITDAGGWKAIRMAARLLCGSSTITFDLEANIDIVFRILVLTIIHGLFIVGLSLIKQACLWLERYYLESKVSRFGLRRHPRIGLL